MPVLYTIHRTDMKISNSAACRAIQGEHSMVAAPAHQSRGVLPSNPRDLTMHMTRHFGHCIGVLNISIINRISAVHCQTVCIINIIIYCSSNGCVQCPLTFTLTSRHTYTYSQGLLHHTLMLISFGNLEVLPEHIKLHVPCCA